MEREGITSTTLPEDLVEKILALVPFPYVFKARALSKSWQARFEPISSQDNEEKKRLATSFQKQVGQSSTKWKTFCPCFISMEDLISYDPESQEWRKLLSLSFLPRQCFTSSNWRIEGALLLVAGYPEMNVRTNMEFFVANILTHSWKKLPPLKREFKFCRNVLIPMKSMYKVVVFKDNYEGASCVACAAQVYDSNLNAWSSPTKTSRSDTDYFEYLVLSDWENLDGVLYRVVSLGPIWGLLAFNVNEETFEELEMGQTDLPLYRGRVGLAVYNGSLLMLVYDSQYPHAAKGVNVLKIDLESRRWWEVTQRTFDSGEFFQTGKVFQKPACDGKCMFFVGEKVASGVLAYNIEEDEWSHFPCPSEAQQKWGSEAIRRTYYKVYNAPTGNYQWEPVSFQPSLNPLGAV